jgi:hypothetical protein
MVSYASRARGIVLALSASSVSCRQQVSRFPIPSLQVFAPSANQLGSLNRMKLAINNRHLVRRHGLAAEFRKPDERQLGKVPTT